MSSVESTVIAYIKSKIEGLSGAPESSPNYYDLNENDSVRNDFIFAIRSGSGVRVPGATGRITWKQNFGVEFSRDFIAKEDNDEALRDALEIIREKLELLSKALVGKPSGNVLNIEPPDFSDPSIIKKDKSVSLTYTFPVTYFILRGA